MNQKILIGFLAGAVGATVITYFAVHRQTSEAPPIPAAAPSAVVATPASTSAVDVPTPEPPRVEKRAVPKKAARIVETAPAPEVIPVQPVTSDPAPPPLVADAPPPAPEPPPPPAPAPPPPAPPAAEPPHSVTLASGSLIPIRLGEGLTTKRNQPGDTFSGTLDKPLQADGFVIAERGAHVEGRVIQSEQAGRVKGLAQLSIELTKIRTSDGQTIEIHTAQFDKTGPESKGEDAAKIGAGAVIGTIIGAIAGGGKGAAIGAGAGGAAGTGTVVATRGKPAELPVETLISFRLDRNVTITERK